jgi:uncharacterized protein (DUF2235 family)
MKHMGQIVSLIVWFVGVVASLAAATWWFNTIVIGFALRWAERYWPLREGALLACRIALFGLWIPFAALTIIFVWVLFNLLDALLGSWLSSSLPSSLVSPGYWVVEFAVWFAVVVGLVVGLSKVVEAWGAAQRRRYLTDRTDPPLQPVNLAVPATAGRRIVILCDGTSDRPDDKPDGESTATNIWKLYNALCNDETQTVWYEAGVGSDSSSTAKEARRTQYLLSTTGAASATKVAAVWETLIKLLESGTGFGISETIINGYSEIVRQYRPGDRIYLVGFSRGAFAARCIAGVISRCGLLHANHEQFAADVVQIYRTRKSADDDEPLRPDMAYPGFGTKLEENTPTAHAVAVHFLGVFDTVASLGFPLWGWWFRVAPIWKNAAFSTDPARVCQNVYHALSMDERRSQFFPTLFTKPTTEPGPAVLEQVWFRGAHADIGGGYTTHELSDITLKWMMDNMKNHGLMFHEWAAESLTPNPTATPHDELVRVPTWNYFGSWPRWHPVPGPDAGQQISALHQSVIARAACLQTQTGRPDLLPVTGKVEFVMNTNVPWFRTGIIIENGKCYRLTYLGGLTRDAECPPCGPEGQDAQGLFDLRRFGTARVPKTPWMTLAASIAHPRVWTPQELGFGKALYYLFRRAPEVLLDQIAVIGRDLRRAGDSVYIINDAPSGLLYLFVNDMWQTAGNNSGGPRIAIELVEQPGPGIVHTLTHSVVMDRNNLANETNKWERSEVHAGAVAA